MFYNENGEMCLTWKGKTQTASEWVTDPDCVVKNVGTLRERAGRMGWDDEKSLTAPLRVTKPRYVTIEGVTKRVPEWLLDPRCKIGAEAFYRRLDTGIDPLEALTTPSGELWGVVTAWNETKNPSDWQDDCRCRVNGRTIVKRIASGMAPEEAIRAPSPKPMTRSPEEWFDREIQAQRLLKEIKGTVRLSQLQLAVKQSGVQEAEVSFSNRHPDGEGSFCLGIWADPRAIPRLAYATAQVPGAPELGRLWRTNPVPRRMHEGYLYLFRHWFATDDEGAILFM